MSARPSSPRKPKAESQLTPDQAAYIHHCLESLVQRGVQTITSTEQVDDQGHTTSVETHRQRTDLPAGQINSWRHGQNEGLYRALLLAPVERMPTYKNLYKRLLMKVASRSDKWI